MRWEVNPDGMYYRDEDGFGMTDDDEINLEGAIDRKGNVVKKFSLEQKPSKIEVAPDTDLGKRNEEIFCT